MNKKSMSILSQHIQERHRMGRLDEFDDEYNPNSNSNSSPSYRRLSSSSTDSRQNLQYTSTKSTKLQRLRSTLPEWGLRIWSRKRIYLIILILLAVTVVIWMSFVAALVHRLSPRVRRNGVHEIVNHWRAENPTEPIPSSRYQDFTRDIDPISCHSHNDYLREVPLYLAIEAGCTSVEADIWLHQNDKYPDKDLWVAHDEKGFKSSATFRKLYIDPLVAILEHQNAKVELDTNDESKRTVGVYDNDSDVSLVLLVDFKNEGEEIWSMFQEQLEPLRKMNMLTSWDGDTKAITRRPVTVVGTGFAPFDLIVANKTYRDVFFDAPLHQLNDDKYTVENSFYASCSFLKVVGLFFLKPSSSQVALVKSQIEAASQRGLISRYWDAPNWPIVRRNNLWRFLTENGVGILNVDDVMNASRWNWDWCIIAGLVLC